MNTFTKKLLKVTAILGLTVTTYSASAMIVTNTVGDIDNLGGAIAPSATSFPNSAFDNRSGAESSAINGAQWTDWSNSQFGIDLPGGEFLGNPTFNHTYAAFSSITSAVWEIGIGGVQSQNDRLFLDEILIASSTDFPSQGSNGYGIISFNITGTALNALLDGSAAFRVNLNSNSTGEPVVFDYAKLTIDGILRDEAPSIPTPSTIALFGLGLLALGLKQRKAK